MVLTLMKVSKNTEDDFVERSELLVEKGRNWYRALSPHKNKEKILT